MKVIVLNGAPRSGKDTATDFLFYHIKSNNIEKIKFADPIKNALKALLGLTDEELSFFDNVKKDEKDHDRLFGYSWRELCIFMSEKMVKILFGKDFFGKVLVKRIIELEKRGIDTVLVSDSGFEEELAPVITQFGANNVTIVQIFRPNTSFNNDSRNYVYGGGLLNIEELQNTGSLDDLDASCLNLASKLNDKQ